MLRETARVGRIGIVSFPNFAHWPNRLRVLARAHAGDQGAALPVVRHAQHPRRHLCRLRGAGAQERPAHPRQLRPAGRPRACGAGRTCAPAWRCSSSSAAERAARMAPCAMQVSPPANSHAPATQCGSARLARPNSTQGDPCLQGLPRRACATCAWRFAGLDAVRRARRRARGCGESADAQGGRAAGRAGQRGPGGAAHGVRQRRIQRPAGGQRVRRTAAARGRHHRAGAFHRRCAGEEGPAAVQHRRAALRRRGGARRIAAGGGERARRPGADRAGALAEAARRQGRVAPGVRPAQLGRAHHAGRHQDRRRGAARGAPEPRVRQRARADHRPRVARQRHRRQPGQRPDGADDDRRHRPGVCLFRRQRADLPARQGAPTRRRRACAWAWPTKPAIRTRAASTSSTTGSTRRPARCACAPASTTAPGLFTPGLAREADDGHQRALHRRCWCPTAPSAPTRPSASSTWSAPTASRRCARCNWARCSTACASSPTAASSPARTSSSTACSAWCRACRWRRRC